MIEKIGGRGRDRTGGPLLAKQIVENLSACSGIPPRSVRQPFATLSSGPLLYGEQKAKLLDCLP